MEIEQVEDVSDVGLLRTHLLKMQIAFVAMPINAAQHATATTTATATAINRIEIPCGAGLYGNLIEYCLAWSRVG